MRDVLAGYAFNVIERNMIWKEYMEGEEGDRELTGKCRLGRQQRDGVVAGARSSRSRHGRPQQQVREAVDGGNTLGKATTRPSSVLTLAIGAPLPWPIFRRTPGRPVQNHGSAGHHQIPTSINSGRHASWSVGHCRRGNEEAVPRLEFTSSLSHVGGSTCCGKTWGWSVDSLTKLSTLLQNQSSSSDQPCDYPIDQDMHPVNTKKEG
jgi:hypothetical protein